MQNKRARHLMVMCLIVLTLLTGCLQSKNIIEKLGIVTAYGFDLNQQQELEGTTVLYQFNPDITNASQIIHSTGKTFDMVRANANKKSGYKIVNGKLQTILFGPSIAEQGIFPYLDTIERNAAISDMLYVTMSETPAQDILSASNYEEAPNVGVYLNRLIETAVQNEEIVSSTFHEYMRSYFNIGREPLIPVLSVENNKVAVDKIGAMQGDVHVGSFSLDEVFYVRLLRDKYNSGRIDLEFDLEPFEPYIQEYHRDNRGDNMYVVIDKLESNTSIQLRDPEKLTYDVTVKLNGRIIEKSHRMNLDQPEPLKQLEKAIIQKMENELIEVVSKSKQLGSDVFGFGVKYNNKTRGEELTRDKWQDLYPNIDVNYDISIDIKRFGIVQ
ncbi:spore germination protein [Alkalibacillus flavidus]|uniref:Spore germination protein n=1 Tax=Alkalibacillus flavidus TaxID=546021 RepID=A0ABV2KVE2_9BACI